MYIEDALKPLFTNCESVGSTWKLLDMQMLYMTHDFYMIKVSFNLLKASSTTKTGRHDITESEVKTQ